MSELKMHHINEVMDMHNLTKGKLGYSYVYYADDVDKVIEEKDATIYKLINRPVGQRNQVMGLIEIWTIIAIVLKLCGIGVFAEWPIIAGPFTWSCMCIELWSIIVYACLLGIYIVLKFICDR